MQYFIALNNHESDQLKLKFREKTVFSYNQSALCHDLVVRYVTCLPVIMKTFEKSLISF